MADDAVLVYRHWIPRAGMRRTYEDLVAAWGNPNHHACTNWPQAVLEQVCQRGEPVTLLYDSECAKAGQYFFASRSWPWRVWPQ